MTRQAISPRFAIRILLEHAGSLGGLHSGIAVPSASSISSASEGLGASIWPVSESGVGPAAHLHPAAAGREQRQRAERRPDVAVHRPTSLFVGAGRTTPAALRPGRARAGFAEESCGPRPPVSIALRRTAPMTPPATAPATGSSAMTCPATAPPAAPVSTRVERVSPQAASSRLAPAATQDDDEIVHPFRFLSGQADAAPPDVSQRRRARRSVPRSRHRRRPRGSSAAPARRRSEHRLVARRIEGILGRHHLAPRAASRAARRRGCRARTARRRNAPRAPPGTPCPPPGRAAAGRHSARAP